MDGPLKVFAGTASRGLATEICERLSLEPGKVKVGRHNDGEVKIEYEESIRDADVFIVNSTPPPAENFFELVFLADAARRSSAGRITLVVPYLGYNRQDRKDRPRVPLSAKVVIKFLSMSGANRVLLLDAHSEATRGFFDDHIVEDHIYASPVTVPYLQKRLGSNFTVGGPDRGAGPRAAAYARLLGMEDYVLFDKGQRPEPGTLAADRVKVIGDVEGKNLLLADDISDTSGTLVADAIAAKKKGARDIYAVVTHAVLSRGAIERLEDSPIKELVVTNSIEHDPRRLRTKRLKITVCSVAPLLAQAIRRIHEGLSVSSLIP